MEILFYLPLTQFCKFDHCCFHLFTTFIHFVKMFPCYCSSIIKLDKGVLSNRRGVKSLFQLLILQLSFEKALWMSFNARISFNVVREWKKSEIHTQSVRKLWSFEIWNMIRRIICILANSHVKFYKILIFLLDRIGCFPVKKVSLSIHKIIINMLNFTTLTRQDCSLWRS